MNERITQTKNMHDFVKHHETMSDDDLRTIYHMLHTLSRSFDNNGQHDISEYYRVQCDAISSLLLFVRFNDNLTDYLRFIDTKK